MTHQGPQPEKRVDLKKQGDFFDYADLSGFGQSYTEQYYNPERPVTDDEKAVTEFFLPFLNSRPIGGSFLDPAAGPTVHHQLLLAPYFDHLETGDYLPDNRSAVEQWRREAPEAKPWTNYSQYYLSVRNQPDDERAIMQLEHETRAKMSIPVFSNLMNNPVVETNKQYDAVGCFYCLEEVASNPQGFHQVVANAAAMLKPGGALLVAALWNSSFYHLKDESGASRVIESFPVTEELLREALTKAGLTIPNGGLRLIETSAQAAEGVSGTLCAYAIRQDAAS
jgi:hypothetical protein